MHEVHWLDPSAITHKIGGASKLYGAQAGDWDREQAYPFRETAKFRSIEAHCLHGTPWLETELFRDVYARRLAQDGHIRGVLTLPMLALNFGRRFDAIFASMRDRGFRLRNRKGKPHPLPSLLVGRDGQVFIGNQGNHRLAIAQVLGLDRFAGRIVCRHPLSSN